MIEFINVVLDQKIILIMDELEEFNPSSRRLFVYVLRVEEDLMIALL